MSNHGVLITGATGYLGSHVVNQLLRRNWKVYVYVRDKNKLKRLTPYKERVILLDTNDDLNIKVDFIIHAATCYGRNGEHLYEIYESNVLLPLKIIESNDYLKETIFINIDTLLDKYVNNYSLSKNHFLELLQHHKNLFKSVINIKLDHFYGPNDDTTKFTQFIVNRCLVNVKSIDLTLGEQIRNFIYIDDVVNAIMKLLNYWLIEENSIEFEEYNVSTDQNISIKNFVQRIHTLTNSQSLLNFGAVPYRVNELMESSVDNTKIRLIGWAPVVTLDEGLTRCIQEQERSNGTAIR